MDEHHDPRRECILADLRAARARQQLDIAACRAAIEEIDAIGVALAEGGIDVQCAIEEMRQLGIPLLIDAMEQRKAAEAAAKRPRGAPSEPSDKEQAAIDARARSILKVAK